MCMCSNVDWWFDVLDLTHEQQKALLDGIVGMPVSVEFSLAAVGKVTEVVESGDSFQVHARFNEGIEPFSGLVLVPAIEMQGDEVLRIAGLSLVPADALQPNLGAK
jgi:hypothetical protein